jgi:hypothetical protein
MRWHGASRSLLINYSYVTRRKLVKPIERRATVNTDAAFVALVQRWSRTLLKLGSPDGAGVLLFANSPR